MTEYEFDDDKITEAGVTVKCTNCSHMFKVRRKAVVETEPLASPPPQAPAQAPAGAAATAPWMIRTLQGEIYNFNELTTLQQWIVERKVSRDDQISRSGDTWKRLGEISELTAFFQVVDAALTAEQMQRNSGAPQAAAAQAGPYESPSTASAPSQAEPDFSNDSSQFAAVGRSAAWEGGGEDLDNKYSSSIFDEIPARKTGKIIAITIICLVLVGGAAFTVWKLGLLTKKSVTEHEAYKAGMKLFLMDDEQSLKLASQQFSTVPKGGAPARAARVIVMAAWVQHLRDEADLLERRASRIETAASAAAAAAAEGTPPQPPPSSPDKDPKVLRLKATKLKHEASKKLTQAVKLASSAQKEAPGEDLVKQAMADTMRLQGQEMKQIRVLIEAARKIRPEDPGIYYVEGALLAAEGNTKKAEDLFYEAISKSKKLDNSNLLRAAYQLALLYFKSGQRDSAMQQVDAILAQNGKHKWTLTLRMEIEAEQHSAPSAGATDPDTGKPPAPGPAAKGTPKAAPSPGAAPKAPAVPERYDALVRKGTQLSERGRTMQALKLFERALKKKPSGVEALAGLAYCHLDQERTGSAIRYFKRALNLSPSYGEALIGVAEASKAQGNKRKALDYYKAYLRTHPHGGKSSIAKRNVSDLERTLGVTAPAPAPAPSPAPAPAPAPGPGPTPSPSPSLPSGVPEQPPPNLL